MNLNVISLQGKAWILADLSFQAPEELECNRGNIYIARTSPPSVINAYYRQYQCDFSAFLRCRARELVPGGRMVLTTLGRRGEHPSSGESCRVWELLAMALDEMVSEVKRLLRNS